MLKTIIRKIGNIRELKKRKLERVCSYILVGFDNSGKITEHSVQGADGVQWFDNRALKVIRTIKLKKPDTLDLPNLTIKVSFSIPGRV